MEPIFAELSEAESLRLIEQAEVGRIGFSGRFGPIVLPVNYKVVNGAIAFRVEAHSALGEDLRTGIPGAEYRVAFEIDDLDPGTRTGWSVMIQGGAHHVEDEAERAELAQAGIDPWAGGEKALFMRIIPALITGRRISRSDLLVIWANAAYGPDLGVPGYCNRREAQQREHARGSCPPRDRGKGHANPG